MLSKSVSDLGVTMRRERIVFAIMVFILIVLFAFTFAVLGKGEYDPSEAFAPVHYFLA
jgi:uncharacterized membrane protein